MEREETINFIGNLSQITTLNTCKQKGFPDELTGNPFYLHENQINSSEL